MKVFRSREGGGLCEAETGNRGDGYKGLPDALSHLLGEETSGHGGQRGREEGGSQLSPDL